MGQAIQTHCPDTRDVLLFFHKKAGQCTLLSAVPASPSLPLLLTENRRDRPRRGDVGWRGHRPWGRNWIWRGSSKSGQELPAISEEPHCPNSGSGVMGSIRSHRTPGGESGWEQHCSALFRKPPPVAHPPHALKEIKSQQGQMPPSRAHQGWRQRCS